jgi:ethanolamine utilization protein EutP (predicted NTPase)
MLATGGPPPTTPIIPWQPPTTTAVDVTNTFYYDTTGEYLWVQTKTWFSQFAVTQGDRIIFSNVTLPSAFSPQGPASADFLSYINRTQGHVVVDIAQMNFSATTLTFRTGSNKLGYSNFIIIRNNFNDPTTGSTSLVSYGGTSALNTAFMNAIKAAPGLASGRLLNLSHQIQVIFRVITRDMDSATRLRPDNL